MIEPSIESVEVAYQGWGRLLKVYVRAADGARITREVEDHGDAAGILAFDPVRRVACLVRQLRAPMLLKAGMTDGLEAIAGLLEEDDPAACAIREAQEEAGLTIRAVEPIGTIWTMPGISTERIHLFMAEYSEADKTGPGGGLAAEDEAITVAEMPLAELARMADHGELGDAKTLVLVQTLRLRRPELFAG